MDSYLQVVTHPFLWIAAGFTVLVFLIQGANSTKDGTQRKTNRTSPMDHLRRHYVSFLTAAALTLFAGALWFYLLEVGLSIHDLVDLLRERAALERADYTDPETGQITFASYEDLRNIGYTAAVLIGVLAATATLIFSLIRVWTNERTTRATEEGLITDRINKAVEGLGAEKKVDQIGRPLTIYFGEQDVYDDLHKSKQDFVLPPRSTAKREKWVENTSDGRDGDGFWSREVTTWTDEETRIEWEDNSLSLASDEHLASKGDWQVFSRSEPNLEVRIGAILSLERIAQDSARDHIQIMEILCAYIRENIGNRPIPPLPEDQTPDGWRAWGKAERTAPRLDIDMALKVIKRRGAGRKAAEAAQEPAFQLGLERLAGTGLDLRGRALEKAVLRGAELQGADLGFAQLQGADLRRAKLQGAHLGDAELKGADLRDAELQGAHLGGAKLQGAHLGGAELQGADLGGAKLQGAHLGDAKLQGAHLWDAKLQGAHLGGAELQGAHLWNAELQGANLGGAKLQGAHLRNAELQGANLGDAGLQGVDLMGAGLQDADLRGAKLQGANLFGAGLQGANLWDAELQGANLGAAKLQGADLGGAKLQGANLGDAKLQGANLMGAEFDAATKLSSATLRGALLRFVDFTNVPQIDAHLDPDQVFFDGSITLPGVITSDMPKWPYEDRRDVLEFGDLNRAWRAWQRAHHPDTLPDHLR
ncbi:pentapeptide repeat-containing protein [Pseudooceanicola sp. 200-1SW]|uniref:pentapeptide repeat-containing protein n=1 Tax=Pseudooceanicola sp. 200-1SW TaxID=3425949 RepID=UPI003D7F7214